ncbi:MAG: branched-chain amino acid aminotransferase [Solirubrobacteraceae bacterium]|jgi:branched-chain amino acid aminotransferase|nr:branched-chain amino acid aminotransferase [Solirubrobacteraceae bacterium]
MSLASLDGTVLPAAEAVIPATDPGLLRGDGVFEVVRLYAGRPFALDDHLERMGGSAANLRLPFDPGSLRADVEALLARAGDWDGLLRLVVTRGGHRLALLEDLPAVPPTVRLASVTYAPPRILDGVKSLSYAPNMLATRLAQEQGADEALLVTPHGRVLEAPTSTFFWVRDGVLRTPPLEEHILDSITRRLVLEEMEVEPASAALDDLAGAQEAFLASTVREVQPVSALDGRELPTDGPVTAQAAERVRSRVEAALASEPVG